MKAEDAISLLPFATKLLRLKPEKEYIYTAKTCS